MKNLKQALQPILNEPTPSALVTLQGALLVSDRQNEIVDYALDAAGHFHAFLSELQSKLTAKQYSELASLLDIGAVGAVALESLLFGDSKDFWQRLVLGSVAEGLMVAASRQYVKGWKAETKLVFTQAAWYLTEALWHISTEMQPDLPSEQRWQSVQTLVAPAYDDDIPAPEKAVLLGLVFQMYLLLTLAPLLQDQSTDPTPQEQESMTTVTS